MAETIEYKVMMVRRDIPELKKLLNDMDGSLTEAHAEYMCDLIDKGQPANFIYINDQSMCVAFTKDMEVVGFITVNPQIETQSIITEHVFVRKKWRKQGVYKLMMKRVEKFAKDIGAKNIMSFVWAGNDLSKKVHQKSGFKKKIIGYIKEVK